MAVMRATMPQPDATTPVDKDLDRYIAEYYQRDLWPDGIPAF
jgi:hypothetical protein